MKNQPVIGTPFIISAPSGTGKTSICKRIRSVIPDLAYSISYTTRARRKGENEGEDYFFVPLETFQKMIDEHRFLEWAQVHGHYYGTFKELVAEKIDKGLDCLFDIDIKGAKRLRKIYPNGIFIFVIPPSLVELESRLSKRRTENQKEIHLRMDNALAELWAFEEYQYLIINDVFSRAVGELKSIILAERCKIEKRRPFVMELLASQVPPG
jgi:guanylate kinase